MVGSLVASQSMFEAERLLEGYVMTRRNALSSTAAIEYALINVSIIVRVALALGTLLLHFIAQVVKHNLCLLCNH